MTSIRAKVIFVGAVGALSLLLWFAWREEFSPVPAVARAKASLVPKERPEVRPARLDGAATDSVELPKREAVAFALKPGDAVKQTLWNDVRDVGRLRPEAAVQSIYAAVRGGDVDYLAKAIVVEPDVRQQLVDLIPSLPAALREQATTPERVAALLLAAAPTLDGFSIPRIEEGGAGSVTATVLTSRAGQDRYSGHRQTLRAAADGNWQRVIDAKDVTRWTRALRDDSPFAFNEPTR